MTLSDDRAAALDACWESIGRRFLDRAHFDEFMQSFQFLAFKDGERTAGAFFFAGPEVHVAIVPAYHRRWATRGLIERCLAPVLERYGYLSTTAQNDAPANIRFVLRLGFKSVHNDGVNTHFVMVPRGTFVEGDDAHLH